METSNGRWLAAHPIHVNLISGVVGFCGGFLTLAIVYNWFLDRERERQFLRILSSRWMPIHLAHNSNLATIGENARVGEWLDSVQEFLDRHDEYTRDHSRAIFEIRQTVAAMGPTPSDSDLHDLERSLRMLRDSIRRSLPFMALVYAKDERDGRGRFTA